MNTTTRSDWRLVRKRFVIAFIGALLFAVLVFFVTGFFREEEHGIVLLSAGGLLWLTCAGVALRRIPLLDVVAVAAGLAWGFLFGLSAAISIQNGRDSVNWPTMVPGLLLIPLAVAVTVLPFWCFSRRRRSDAG
jgi:hypothetical protein